MRDKIYAIITSFGLQPTQKQMNDIESSVKYIMEYEYIKEDQLENMIFCYLRDNDLIR